MFVTLDGTNPSYTIGNITFVNGREVEINDPELIKRLENMRNQQGTQLFTIKQTSSKMEEDMAKQADESLAKVSKSKKTTAKAETGGN